MKAPDSATAAIVRALREIKSDISDGTIATFLTRLKPPEKIPEPPRSDEMRLFSKVLGEDKIGAASWFMIATEAGEQGYYLPSNTYVMATIVEQAAGKAANSRRRACAWHGRQVARACAAIYWDLTRASPPILNYRQVGNCSNRYAGLVEAAFTAAGLSGWQWAAEKAAREWKLAVEYKKET